MPEPPAAAPFGAVGSTFDMIESWPNRCTTTPEGGGAGFGRAMAASGNQAVSATVKTKNLPNVFLRPRQA